MTTSRRGLAEALRRRDVGALVRMFEPLAQSIAGAYYAPGLHRDDLIQEARIGIADAVRDFRGDPPGFPGFAALCAKRKVITAVVAARRGKHSPLNDSTSLQREVGDDDGDGTLADIIPLHGSDPALQYEVRENVNGLLARIALDLTPLERACLLGVVAGDRYATIAAACGVSPKTVDNAVLRARKKLQRPRRTPVLPLAKSRAVGQRVYVPRWERRWPAGARTADEAARCARAALGDAFLDADACVTRCALGPDGVERADTRGRPRADGKRPRPVWRVELRVTDLPATEVA